MQPGRQCQICTSNHDSEPASPCAAHAACALASQHLARALDCKMFKSSCQNISGSQLWADRIAGCRSMHVSNTAARTAELICGAPSTSANTQPTAQMSTAGPYVRAPYNSSGARYLREPHAGAKLCACCWRPRVQARVRTLSQHNDQAPSGASPQHEGMSTRRCFSQHQQASCATGRCVCAAVIACIPPITIGSMPSYAVQVECVQSCCSMSSCSQLCVPGMWPHQYSWLPVTAKGRLSRVPRPASNAMLCSIAACF
jgi:hypothetical protein